MGGGEFPHDSRRPGMRRGVPVDGGDDLGRTGRRPERGRPLRTRSGPLPDPKRAGDRGGRVPQKGRRSDLWFGVRHSLPGSVGLVLGRSSSYRDAILQAVNLDDDADTTGAICGQLAGAYYGDVGIPNEWLSRLVMSDDIRSLADKLAKPKKHFTP